MLEVELAAKLGIGEAGKFHQENFRSRKWSDTGTRWPARKDGDTSRALLVKTGRLRRSAITGRRRGNVAQFVLPGYGKVHNEGLKAGRGEGFFMPRRQFAGKSRILIRRFDRKARLIVTRRLNRQ